MGAWGARWGAVGDEVREVSVVRVHTVSQTWIRNEHFGIHPGDP